jgi:hypothetical protein
LKLFSFSVRGELVEPQKILLQEAPLISFNHCLKEHDIFELKGHLKGARRVSIL